MSRTKVLPSKTKIGWIGTGVMGSSMCRHIVDKGYKTYVYSRTKEKAKKLIESGATWLNSPQAVVENSDVVFTMVGFPEDVREVYFGGSGVIKGVKPGSILVDMTTTEPSLSKEIYKEARLKKATSIDAPVSGGDIGAKEGTL